MMHRCQSTSLVTLLLLLVAGVTTAQEPPRKDSPPTTPPVPKKEEPASKPPASPPAEAKLPMTDLQPAKAMPNVCLLHYRVSTSSPECQTLFDQGLGYFYSYVWMEAARSFETAARRDPDCALAWWGLSRALEKWSKSNHNQALQKAKDLLGKASHREQYLINARLAEKGMLPNVSPTDRKPKTIAYLDEMLTLYDDDEEGWYYRAQQADGQYGKVPFYKALLRVNPLHPGANHELVHFYENIQRPGLGWPHAEKYIASSPGIPHAFHMQAHLGTRLGHWDKTTDYSSRAIDLHREYQKEMKVTTRQDYQFTHHLQILTISLIHDGRYREARAIKDEASAAGFRHEKEWFYLYLGARDWDEARKLVDQQRRRDKVTGSYYGALLALRKGDLEGARAEVEVLREAYQRSKNDALESRLYETQGLLMCMTDGGDAGVKLLQKVVNKTKDSFSHHAWGNGAYYMEGWGVGALRANKMEAAEEGFLEALAHDPGSARGALGMQVVCERQGRTQEAARFAAVARKAWRKADSGVLEAELAWLRGDAIPVKSEKPDATKN
jgi:tetratricopeptide (TPR) repeat protein